MSSPVVPSSPEPAAPPGARPEITPIKAVPELRALSRRAVLIGLLLVIFVAAITPYNDNALNNSKFIGNHFPIGIMTLMVALMLIVNPLLQLFKRPRLAKGELIVIMTMLLIAASVPSSGLMRHTSNPW